MALIQVRFEINRGGQGAPLDKLAEIAQKAERFLRSLAVDLSMDSAKGDWLAINFANGSVSFDAAFEAAPSVNSVHAYTAAVRALIEYDPIEGVPHPDVGEKTLEQFCRLGELMEPHERLGIGLYDGKPVGEPAEWRYLTRRKAAEIRQELDRPVVVYSSVQGVIHSWFKESDPPYFNLRDAAGQVLVKCLYPEKLYPTLVGAFHERNTVVHAAGTGRFIAGGRLLIELNVDRLQTIRPLSEAEFNSLFGIAPGFTGEMNTAEYVEALYGD